ncbi:MAG: hypothetical protein ACM3X0_02910 [Bacteroidota bacterium]
MDFILGFLLLDIGVAIGIGLMCLITLRGGCYEGCLMRKAAGIGENTAGQEKPLVRHPAVTESQATPPVFHGELERPGPGR